MVLQMGEQHLDLAAFAGGALERLGSREAGDVLAHLLMRVDGQGAVCRRGALRLERAAGAIGTARTIEQYAVVAFMAEPQVFAARADEHIALAVESEVVAREDAIGLRRAVCALRPGNVHSANGWEAVLKPVVARYQGKVSRIYFRADAGFANPEVYEYLEAERIKYAIRLPANHILQERIGYLLKRPVGRPSNDVCRSHASFTYQAGSWSQPRRVVAKVEWHPGELYPRVGFIVTNMSRPAENVVAFYNKRGTCEQWIKEGKGAIKWTRLSCRSFAANAVRLQLHALAYNLGNFLRTLATPEPIKDWSLTTLKEKLIKIGAKVISHGRYVAFQMAEVAIPKNLFANILRLIAELRPPLVISTA